MDLVLTYEVVREANGGGFNGTTFIQYVAKRLRTYTIFVICVHVSLHRQEQEELFKYIQIYLQSLRAGNVPRIQIPIRCVVVAFVLPFIVQIVFYNLFNKISLIEFLTMIISEISTTIIVTRIVLDLIILHDFYHCFNKAILSTMLRSPIFVLITDRNLREERVYRLLKQYKDFDDIIALANRLYGFAFLVLIVFVFINCISGSLIIFSTLQQFVINTDFESLHEIIVHAVRTSFYYVSYSKLYGKVPYLLPAIQLSSNNIH